MTTKIPASLGTRYRCQNGILGQGGYRHDSGDGKPSRKKCSGCGGEFKLESGYYFVLRLTWEQMNVPMSQLPMSTAVNAFRTEAQAKAWSEKQEHNSDTANYIEQWVSADFSPDKLEEAIAAVGSRTATIEARGVCARCHEQKILAGAGALCQDCLDEIEQGEPLGRMEGTKVGNSLDTELDAIFVPMVLALPEAPDNDLLAIWRESSAEQRKVRGPLQDALSRFRGKVMAEMSKRHIDHLASKTAADGWSGGLLSSLWIKFQEWLLLHNGYSDHADSFAFGSRRQALLDTKSMSVDELTQAYLAAIAEARDDLDRWESVGLWVKEQISAIEAEFALRNLPRPAWPKAAGATSSAYRESPPIADGFVVVKVDSHRATDKLNRLVGPSLSYGRWDHEGIFHIIPAEHLAEATAIKGITHVKRPEAHTDHHLHWGQDQSLPGILPRTSATASDNGLGWWNDVPPTGPWDWRPTPGHWGWEERGDGRARVSRSGDYVVYKDGKVIASGTVDSGRYADALAAVGEILRSVSRVAASSGVACPNCGSDVRFIGDPNDPTIDYIAPWTCDGCGMNGTDDDLEAASREASQRHSRGGPFGMMTEAVYRHASAGTCTVVVGPEGQPCGKPSVSDWTNSRGETFYECEDHAITPSAAPSGGLAVGDKVKVDHVGVEKRGEVTWVGPANCKVRVPVYEGTNRATTKEITVPKDSVRKTALGEVKAPPDVDTLRDEACPVCGETDGFTGEDCAVCGFKKPPSFATDPDTERASREDLRKDQGGQAAQGEGLEQFRVDGPAPSGTNDSGEGLERFRVAAKEEVIRPPFDEHDKALAEMVLRWFDNSMSGVAHQDLVRYAEAHPCKMGQVVLGWFDGHTSHQFMVRMAEAVLPPGWLDQGLIWDEQKAEWLTSFSSKGWPTPSPSQAELAFGEWWSKNGAIIDEDVAWSTFEAVAGERAR
jgi:hypothetical protein